MNFVFIVYYEPFLFYFPGTTDGKTLPRPVICCVHIQMFTSPQITWRNLLKLNPERMGKKSSK